MDTTLHLPFTLHERNGEVEVHYATNDDVVKSGFDILKNLKLIKKDVVAEGIMPKALYDKLEKAFAPPPPAP